MACEVCRWRVGVWRGVPGAMPALPRVACPAGDGRLDLFVANYHGVNCLYHNEGGGSFAKVTTGDVATDSGNSLGAAWGDYDGAPVAHPLACGDDVVAGSALAGVWLAVRCGHASGSATA